MLVALGIYTKAVIVITVLRHQEPEEGNEEKQEQFILRDNKDHQKG